MIGLALKRPRPMMLQLPGIMLPEIKILKVYAIIAPLAQEEIGKKDLRVF